MVDRRLLLAIVLVGTAFAGCASSAHGGSNSETLDVRVDATPTTGVIRGLVVDTAIHPLAGVRVQMKVSADKVVEANTTANGAFGFQGLAPGTYFVEAHKRGFIGTRVSTQVVAGVSEPPITKLAMESNPSEKPYLEEFLFKGFLECGVTSPVVGVAVCHAPASVDNNLTQDVTQVNYNFGANLTWVQSEMVWAATNPAGKDLNLWHSYSCPPQTLYCDHGPRGPSPLMVADNATWIHTLGLDAGIPLYMRVFSAELDGTHPPPPADHVCEPNPLLGGQVCVGGVGVALEQDFNIYTFAFHNFEPIAGYLFTRDGPPVVPPA